MTSTSIPSIYDLCNSIVLSINSLGGRYENPNDNLVKKLIISYDEYDRPYEKLVLVKRGKYARN
jgi:hypothetical protein